MFGSFRKHQKWIWILGVIVIIPSFVIFFSPDAKWAGGAGGENYNLGSIRGEPIKLNEFRPAFASGEKKMTKLGMITMTPRIQIHF